VQWSTNGISIPDATNAALSLEPQSLGSGTHTVSALVRDLTPLVRNDLTNLLSQKVTWALTVNLATLQLDSVSWLPSGQFAFRISGNAPQGFVIQGSTNLLNWIPVMTNSLVGGQFWYTNSSASNFSARFFRAVTPP
jgi:hypothetical protein